MAQPEKRVSERSNATTGGLTAYPYLAKVITHLDKEYQAALEVTLIKDPGNQTGDETQTYQVKYSSPFYSCTPYDFTTENLTYDDAQQAYGFYGPPPDTGVVGIVIFIDGKADKGYWLCSVQDRFQNHMIPAIAGSKNYVTKEDFEQAEHPLPVVEHNRKANKLDKNLEIDKIKRAVHPFAHRIKVQGLIRDEFRGTSTSTVRRDVPNMVFGMSTPGPLNRSSKKKPLGNRQSLSGPVPINRWGGTQFVMDDGDDRYFREKKPWDGPPTYLKNPAGDKEIPYSEYFRIRTRTGHQILMNNSEDLIYIANSRGTAWIEITSDGKIDIFSTDSINIRTKQDYNLYCDRDFNLEVGRNFNLKVKGEHHSHIGKDNVVIVDRDQKIIVKRRKDETINEQFRQTVLDDVKKYYAKDYTHNIDGRVDFKVAKGLSATLGKGSSGPGFAPYDDTRQDPADPCANDAKLSVPVKDHEGPTPDRIDIKIFKDTRIEQVGVNFDHTVKGEYKLTVEKDQNINVTGKIVQTAGKNIEIKSGGNILKAASKIKINDPDDQPGTANKTEIPEESRVTAKATLPMVLVTHKLPDLEKPSAKDSPIDLVTILRRVPTPEPYPWHENLDPKPTLKPKNLDRDVNKTRYKNLGDPDTTDLRTPPSDWKKYKKPGDNPF